jgi:membrane-bound metal-dependent hydrolase YbcI (DUF457 family)
MQIYTHAAVGAALGLVFIPEQWGLVALGAVAPDLVMGPTFVRDRAAARRPLAAQPPWLRRAKELSHSTFLWAFALWWGAHTGNPAVAALGFGGVSHVVLDALSHGDPHINYQDHQLLYPFKSQHAILLWDYRYDSSARLWPIKPPELVVLMASVVLALCLLVN